MNKTERKLQENLDYVVVNKIVWQVIVKLYGGGPEVLYQKIK